MEMFEKKSTDPLYQGAKNLYIVLKLAKTSHADEPSQHHFGTPWT